MLNIKKILLPVDFPNTSLQVIHEAAALAHHFHSEITMLHVVTAQSHAAGVPDAGPELNGWDLLAEINKAAVKDKDEFLGPELDDLTIQRVLVTGDAAQAIMQMTEDEQIDLIMMPSHGQTFSQFLLGSVTAKVLNGTDCPIWTDAHVDESRKRNFAIRGILCAIDFDSRNHITLSWAAQLAAEFGAHLTVAHVTAGVELWGPGGSYVNERWKEELVSDASEHIAKLQQDVGTKADVFIGSGDVPRVLSKAVEQTNADLLVNGSRPYGERLRTHGYAIICAVPIPVLSV
jgi:nucleotide-binding universal stress UspA family protein